MSRVEGCEETAEVDLEAAEDGRTPEAEAMVLPLACVDERFFVLLINSNQTPNPMLAVPADYRYCTDHNELQKTRQSGCRLLVSS